MLLTILKKGTISNPASVVEILKWEDGIIERLKTMLRDTNPSVRSLSAEAIGLLNGLEAVDLLEEIARSDPKASVREKASKVINKLKKASQIIVEFPKGVNMKILHISLVNLPEITISAMLVDENSRFIDILKKENIVLIENGRSMDFKFEKIGEEMPISVAVLMDYSFSMSDEDISKIEKAVIDFISSIKPKDQIAILKFASDIIITQPLVRADQISQSGVRKKFKGSKGGTLLYDALDKAISILSGLEGIKLVIVLTDGEDSGSSKTDQDIIKYALKTGVNIYTIGLGDEVDTKALRSLALKTGGNYYATGDPNELGKIYSQISILLQLHYKLTYTSWAYNRGIEKSFLIVKADLGPIKSEACARIILKNG